MTVQIISACITGLATITALAVAVSNVRQRRTDASNRALAQARLVITGTRGPTVTRSTVNATQTQSIIDIEFRNCGDRPVLDAYAEVWLVGMQRDERPYLAHEHIITPDEMHLLAIYINNLEPSAVIPIGWRIRWTDADGRQWCRDRFPQELPDPFKKGQLPRFYPEETTRSLES